MAITIQTPCVAMYGHSRGCVRLCGPRILAVSPLPAACPGPRMIPITGGASPLTPAALRRLSFVYAPACARAVTSTRHYYHGGCRCYPRKTDGYWPTATDHLTSARKETTETYVHSGCECSMLGRRYSLFMKSIMLFSCCCSKNTNDSKKCLS